MALQTDILAECISSGIRQIRAIETIMTHREVPAGFVFDDPFINPSSPSLLRVVNAIITNIESHFVPPDREKVSHYVGGGSDYSAVTVLEREPSLIPGSDKDEPGLIKFRALDFTGFILKSRIHNTYSLGEIPGEFNHGTSKQLKLSAYLIKISSDQKICRVTRIITCSALFQEVFRPPAGRSIETPPRALLRKHICKFYAGHQSCADETHDHNKMRDLILELRSSGYSSVYLNSLFPTFGSPVRPRSGPPLKRIYFKEFIGIPAFNSRFMSCRSSTRAVPNPHEKRLAARHYIEQCARLFRTQGFVGDAKIANILMTLHSAERRGFTGTAHVYVPIDYTAPVYTYPTYWGKTFYAPLNSHFIDLLKGRYDAEYDNAVRTFQAEMCRHFNILRQQGFLRTPMIPASFELYNRGEDTRGFYLYCIMMQSFVGIAFSVFVFLYHDLGSYPEYIHRVERPLRFCEPPMLRAYRFSSSTMPRDMYDFIKEIIERTYVHGFSTWENFLANLLAFIDNFETWTFSPTAQYVSSAAEGAAPSVNPFEYVSFDMEEKHRLETARKALVGRARSFSVGAATPLRPKFVRRFG